VYTKARQLHSSVTSLVAASGIVTATLRSIQPGTTCGLAVAHTILQVDKHIRCTNPALAYANSRANISRRQSTTTIPVPHLVSIRTILASRRMAALVHLGTRFQALPGNHFAQLVQIGATMITIGVKSLGAT